MTTYLKLEHLGKTIAVCKIIDKKILSVSEDYIHQYNLNLGVGSKLEQGFSKTTKDEFNNFYKKQLCNLLTHL